MSWTSTLTPVSFSYRGASVFFTTVPHVAGKNIACSVTGSAARAAVIADTDMRSAAPAPSTERNRLRIGLFANMVSSIWIVFALTSAKEGRCCRPRPRPAHVPIAACGAGQPMRRVAPSRPELRPLQDRSGSSRTTCRFPCFQSTASRPTAVGRCRRSGSD